jgi:TRAP-type mannitol/chloroaromatic compound transport system permease large subunit
MEFQAIVGLAGFAVMLAMVLVGIPIFVSLLSVTFAGIVILEHGDMTQVFTQFMTAPYARAAEYTFAVLPLFMLLGVLAGETGVGEGAYTAVARFTNRVRGGLLMATVGGNAVFGAVSGMSLAAKDILHIAMLVKVQIRRAFHGLHRRIGTPG